MDTHSVAEGAKPHKKFMYNWLLLSGKLYDDLHQTDEEAEHLLDMILPQMAQDAGLTEALKASDPIEMGRHDEYRQNPG